MKEEGGKTLKEENFRQVGNLMTHFHASCTGNQVFLRVIGSN